MKRKLKNNTNLLRNVNENLVTRPDIALAIVPVYNVALNINQDIGLAILSLCRTIALLTEVPT